MTSRDSSPYRLENIRSAIGHYLLGRGAAAVAGLAFAILLVRHMPLKEYAGYTAVMGVAGIASILASLGLERVVTRFVPEARLGMGGLFLRGLVWRLALARALSALSLCACLAVAWPWVVSWFDFVQIRTMPLAMAVYLLAVATTSLLAAVLQALVQQRLLTSVNVLQWGGRLAWISWWIANGGALHLDQVLWIMAVPELAGAVALALSAAKAIRGTAGDNDSPDPKSREPDWREVRHLAQHSYGFNLLASLPQGYFMRTLVAASLPVETVAAFGFFSNLVDRLRMYLPMQLMYNLIEPVMVARYLKSGDIDALNRNAQVAFKINVIVLGIALIIFIVGGSQLISALTGGRFLDQEWIVILLILQLISGSQILAIQLVLNVLKANHILSWAGSCALIVMLFFLLGSLKSAYPILILFGSLIYSITLNSIARIAIRRDGVPCQTRLRDNIGILLIAVILSLGARCLTEQMEHMTLLVTLVLIMLITLAFLLLVILTGLAKGYEFRSLVRTISARAADK